MCHFLSKNLNFEMDKSRRLEMINSTISAFKKNRKFMLTMANGIFINSNFTLNENFKNILTENYDSEVKNIDFENDTQSHITVNNWIAQKTNNCIKDMINEISDSTICLIINAIYFKAKWIHEFSPENTKPSNFKLITNQSDEQKYQQVNMMSFDEPRSLAYFSDSNENLFFLLPYKCDKNKKMSMVVMLPSEKNSLSGNFNLNNKEDSIINLLQINENLNNKDDSISNSLQINEKSLPNLLDVELYFPKFNFNYKIELKDTLTKMGLKRIFNPYSEDFSPILEKKSDDTIYVSNIIQQAFITVDEAGTEAAVATEVLIQSGCNSINSEIEYKIINVDRPFGFWIVDHGKGPNDMFILFAGKIFNPDFLE